MISTTSSSSTATNWITACVLLLAASCSLTVVRAFAPRQQHTPLQRVQQQQSSSTTALFQAGGRLHRNVCLLVEPTPFTHVSGYANRFQEMLKYMQKAGDHVDILTVDSKTPPASLPTKFGKYEIQHTQGFTFPLYNHISLTVDLPEMKGAKLLEERRPDIMHVTSPGFLVFAALFYARTLKIPLIMSYHTHLPTYGMFI